MKQEYKEAIRQHAKEIGWNQHNEIMIFNSAEFGYHLRDDEVKELSEWNESKSKIIHGQQQEIERLKGLIEDAYFDAWNMYDYSLNMVRCFEEFKQKHGL